ncbi:hypothetical protein ACH42_16085 [Endozoicomonas sp. (ex Bugula neritina AB1)]|nr:hypothetical protein ACH42_16085 [Endozoicomonas sp. (ex Bugula neritina AB1)]
MLSFIIPAYNEEQFIKRSIQSIQSNVEGIYDYEIIVVDNASTDNTANIARELGVAVISTPHKFTISAVRNTGVEISQGDILIFIDGDVYLHDSWIDHVPPVLEQIKSSSVVAGSVYAVDPDASWVAKAWFQPWYQKQEQVTFINGGHMLLSRELFQQIGGFDVSFETGEDYEFCERARSVGAVVANLESLIAVHLGYPNSLKHFFRRERWHGKGNFSPCMRIFASRIPIITLLILISLVFSLVAPLITGNVFLLLTYPLFAGMFSAATAFKWIGGISPNFLQCMFLAWLYFTARGFSFLDVVKDSFFGAIKVKV